jgi:hypothetical protein
LYTPPKGGVFFYAGLCSTEGRKKARYILRGTSKEEKVLLLR